MENAAHMIRPGTGHAGQGGSIPINDVVARLNRMIKDEILQPVAVLVFHHQGDKTGPVGLEMNRHSRLVRIIGESSVLK